jgi:hypothetical protein
MNRRQQEAREDKTRWYEQRRQAYVNLVGAASGVFDTMQDVYPTRPSEAEVRQELNVLQTTMAQVRLVGSPEVNTKADELCAVALSRNRSTNDKLAAHKVFGIARTAFEQAARHDLGHPSQ